MRLLRRAGALEVLTSAAAEIILSLSVATSGTCDPVVAAAAATAAAAEAAAAAVAAKAAYDSGEWAAAAAGTQPPEGPLSAAAVAAAADAAVAAAITRALDVCEMAQAGKGKGDGREQGGEDPRGGKEEGSEGAKGNSEDPSLQQQQQQQQVVVEVKADGEKHQHASKRGEGPVEQQHAESLQQRAQDGAAAQPAPQAPANCGIKQEPAGAIDPGCRECKREPGGAQNGAAVGGDAGNSGGVNSEASPMEVDACSSGQRDETAAAGNGANPKQSTAAAGAAAGIDEGSPKQVAAPAALVTQEGLLACPEAALLLKQLQKANGQQAHQQAGPDAASHLGSPEQQQHDRRTLGPLALLRLPRVLHLSTTIRSMLGATGCSLGSAAMAARFTRPEGSFRALDLILNPTNIATALLLTPESALESYTAFVMVRFGAVIGGWAGVHVFLLGVFPLGVL